MKTMTEPATPASPKAAVSGQRSAVSHEELYFQLNEAENLLQAARNRISEAAVKLYDLADSRPDADLGGLGKDADDLLQELTTLANRVHGRAEAQRYRAQTARIKKGGAS